MVNRGREDIRLLYTMGGVVLNFRLFMHLVETTALDQKRSKRALYHNAYKDHAFQ